MTYHDPSDDAFTNQSLESTSLERRFVYGVHYANINKPGAC